MSVTIETLIQRGEYYGMGWRPGKILANSIRAISSDPVASTTPRRLPARDPGPLPVLTPSRQRQIKTLPLRESAQVGSVQYVITESGWKPRPF